MVEKTLGAKMDCLNCGEELTCGWSKASGQYKAKLQWQNPDGTAHFTKFDGSMYVCPNVKTEEKGDLSQAKKIQDELIDEKELSKGKLVNVRNNEQKVIDAIQMLELLWCPALEKAKEVYKIQSNTTTDGTIHTNKDVMILSQVFFKAMVENYNK